LVANTKARELEEQVRRCRPARAVLCDGRAPVPTGDTRTQWASGWSALLDVVADPDVDVVVNALVGAAGLEPTLLALESGHRLALANKESLVAGGDLVVRAAERGGGEIVPIDSEHSAILQCVRGRPSHEVQRVVLTASGGPFRGRNLDELWHVGPEEALRHPTWDMGAKITIDSATLANKALEVIEAHHLYGLGYDAIEAVIHPQSVIHSFVEFVDGSVLAQLGFPTMELPILYALSYPDRVADEALRTYDPVASSPLTFQEIDRVAFPLFGLGFEAGRRGGCGPAVYNAGNEIGVQAFLEGKIRFPEMAEVVHETMEQVGADAARDVKDVLTADAEARSVASEAVRRLADARAGAKS
jgi:1-deoxy-D-xylulose-5-phosphate reductoisomerase